MFAVLRIPLLLSALMFAIGTAVPSANAALIEIDDRTDAISLTATGFATQSTTIRGEQAMFVGFYQSTDPDVPVRLPTIGSQNQFNVNYRFPSLDPLVCQTFEGNTQCLSDTAAFTFTRIVSPVANLRVIGRDG